MLRHIRWALLALAACGTPAQSGPPAPPASAAPAPSGTADSCGMPDVVAEIGGQPVTRDDLMAFGASEIVEAEVASANARKEALDQLIMQRLVEAEAKKVGKSLEQYMKDEIESKLTEPTEAEIQSFYLENQRQIRGTLDEVRPQLAGYLKQQKGAELMTALVDRLVSAGGVKRHLQPYRIAVDPGDGVRWGSADAPVQIVEFSDFQCPYCSRGADTIDQVKEKYGDKVSVVFRHFPLPFHTQAGRAAEAAECAGEQERFWEFHDALFAEQKPWTDEDYTAIAKKLDLKAKPFAECLESGRHAAKVEKDIADGRAVGMGGTPGFYINGVVLTGAQPIEVFAEVIDAELARTGG